MRTDGAVLGESGEEGPVSCGWDVCKMEPSTPLADQQMVVDLVSASESSDSESMKVHRFVPSHRTGCVEMMVNSSMNSRGNGRLTLNRFVLDKSHLRMRYDMLFSTFSGSLHSA